MEWMKFRKLVKLALWITLLVFLVNSLASMAASAQPSSPTMAQEKNRVQTSSDLQPTAQEKKLPSGSDMPVYKPPFRGAPAGRVGGGTRGIEDEDANIVVLAPDHTGLTANRQPSLYWFLSANTAFPVEFTLIEQKAVKPLVEERLAPPKRPGIHSIRLADYGITLEEDRVYQWFVTLIPDPERRSKDLLSGGFIQRVEPSRELREKLDRGKRKEAVHLYAEAGLWYDAFMTVCHMIESSPDDARLQQMRASLLEQVGLGHIAEDLK
jgi:hypothetical protein